MYIRHERPVPEITNLISCPVTLTTGSDEDILINRWSMSGVEWPYTGTKAPSTATLKLNFQGFHVAFPVQLGRTEDPRFYEFVGLDGRQREVMRAFYEGIVSGQMVNSGLVIESLDAPVDLVPMTETEQEREEAQKMVWPRKIRALISLGIYAVLGLVIFAAIASTLWERLNWIEVSNARIVAAPTATVGAPTTNEGTIFFEGWLADKHLTEVYAGMPGVVEINIGGTKTSFEARVAKLTVGGRPGFQDSRGFLVSLISVADVSGFDPSVFRSGAPVRVKLDADISPLIGKSQSGSN